MIDDAGLAGIAARLTDVPGLVGVVLGGSRARGDHVPTSDVDLGLYYRPPLDVADLTAVAQEVAGPDAAVTRPGEWGPWVDGGAWLRIADTAVDWIYRDVDRVRAAWHDAQAGRYAFHFQVGHPLGVPDFSYAGELALGSVLADPTGELTRLRAHTRTYPPRLATVLVPRVLWEARFCIDIAGKAVPRGDATYVAGCLFRAAGLCAHALHGHAGAWLVNEKGAVTAAGRLPGAPPGFAARVHALLGEVGATPETLALTLDVARELVRDVERAVAV